MAGRSKFEFSDCVYDGVLEALLPRTPWSQVIPSDLPVARFDVPRPNTPETPVLDKILDDQDVNKDLFLVFVGRWFFDMGHLDDWGLTPAIIGACGTGKSTILNALRKVYGDRTGVVGNYLPYRHFRLSVIADCLSWIAPDIRCSTARIEAPGKMVIDRLHKPPKVVDWRAPGWIAGNEMPEDCRNLQVFQFDKPVGTHDSTLSAQLEQELPHIVVKGIRAYHVALRRYGRRRPDGGSF